jgi:flagellar L-ring protein precursor FlgH
MSQLVRRLMLLAVLPLGACGSVSETVMGPKLTPISYPAKAIPSNQNILGSNELSDRPASPNSLWRNGARAFFHDQRASKVGDILTVQVEVNDNAAVSNATTTSRASAFDGGLTHLFGLESNISKALPNSPDPAHLLTSGATSSLAGTGTVKRSEAVSLTIAAVVTGVLPNGNLMIQGRQEVMVNQEVRELTVAGIVRPEDITSANTINHTQIAEARVSYGGRGQLTRQQGTPAAQALAEKFSPF